MKFLNGILLVILLVILISCNVHAQKLPPTKFDGFVYGNHSSQFNPNRILIEAFFDPLCPDSRNAWPPLKKVLHDYGSRVSVIVHPFPLPYHDAAFVSARFIHIVNEFNKSATYHLWEKFFKHQEKFYNDQIINKRKSEVIRHITGLVLGTIGYEHHLTLKSGLNDYNTDLKTRVSFKYACSRGAFGTPTFFVNGFILPGVGSPIKYKDWKNIIDPLIS